MTPNQLPAAIAAEACCVCGGGPVTYRNYREQPFCRSCADPGVNAEAKPSPREQYEARVECAIGLNVDCGGTVGVHIVRDAVMAVRDAELAASQRRAVTFVERIDAARAWARQHLDPEQQTGLLAVLGGFDPNAKCRHCRCPAGSTQCEHCNCCDVPDQPKETHDA